MIRPIIVELLLFLTPFAAYAFMLWAKSRGVFDPESWPLRSVVALTITALVLMGISAFIAAQMSGAPPGSTYVPAHVEGGRMVPGTTK
jgi:TRAP-type mannitol/chloroaromatic compound transport system permease small subunit